jgi:hypothetical protein
MQQSLAHWPHDELLADFRNKPRRLARFDKTEYVIVARFLTLKFTPLRL